MTEHTSGGPRLCESVESCSCLILTLSGSLDTERLGNAVVKEPLVKFPPVMLYESNRGFTNLS